jgi:hypothetical protein
MKVKTEWPVFVAYLALAALVGTTMVQAQNAPLPTGTVQLPLTQLNHCPSGFFNGGPGNPATCYQTTVTCPNTNYDNVTFSYANPAAPNAPKGTIVLFSSGGGTTPSTDIANEAQAAQDYWHFGFAVMQTAWQWDWEDTNYPLPRPTYAYNIMNGACRPATLLSFINSNLTPQFHFPSTGMCAQGTSGGSGAMGYALAWYGAGTYLNNVELIDGPVFGDVKLGCKFPLATSVTICPPGQFGCSPGTVTEVQNNPWSNAPQYIANYLSSVQTWTGNLAPACNNTQQQSTTLNDPIWKQQSIVNGQGGSFGYPITFKGMAGWMCYSYAAGSCTPGQNCPNNSAAEGKQFYNQFTQANSPNAYTVKGVQECQGAEGVNTGEDPDNLVKGSALPGIESHMKNNCTP